MRLGARTFLWKWVLFAWEWKMISISRAEHLPLFWNRGQGELENGLFHCYSCDVRDERVTASARATYQNCLRQKEYFWYFKNPLERNKLCFKARIFTWNNNSISSLPIFRRDSKTGMSSQIRSWLSRISGSVWLLEHCRSLKIVHLT